MKSVWTTLPAEVAVHTKIHRQMSSQCCANEKTEAHESGSQIWERSYQKLQLSR